LNYKYRAPLALAGSILSAFVLAGCGGGGGDGGGTPVVGTRAVLDAVEAKSSSLHNTAPTPAEFNSQMAAYLATQTAFEASGVDDATSSVWARFKNGRLLIIANNRPAEPVTDRSAAISRSATRAEGIPTPTQARLLHSFGPNFDLVQAPLQDIGAMLTANGYVLTGGNTGDSRLSILQKVAGDGFFYFNTHGGRGKTRNGGDMFAMQSSTLVTDAIDNFAETKDDLENNRLVYFQAPNGNTVTSTGEPEQDTRYGITSQFVEKYWSFGKNSVLFFNVCFSGFIADPNGALPFINACHRKGAGVYLGWAKAVSPNAAFKGVRYFVDRMIGANTYKPEDPKQRPFAVADVLKDMARLKLDTDSSTGAKLLPFVNPAGDSPVILAPSISFMGVNEFTKVLTINGIFGKDMGKVTVGGKELGIKSWNTHAIECNIDPGDAGDTIVEVRNHKSNVVQLTEWVGTFTTFFEPGLGTLKQVGFLEVHFRADVHSHRDVPHETPFDPIVPFQSEQTSIGQFTSSGTESHPCDDKGGISTTTWSGTANLQALQLNNPKNLVTCFGNIDVKQKKIDIELAGASLEGMTETVVGCGNSTSDTLPGITGTLDADDTENPVLHLTLNDDFSINGGIRDQFIGPLHFRMEWTKIIPRFPPNKMAARGVSTKRSVR
jgi:hypothetical protein